MKWRPFCLGGDESTREVSWHYARWFRMKSSKRKSLREIANLKRLGNCAISYRLTIFHEIWVKETFRMDILYLWCNLLGLSHIFQVMLQINRSDHNLDITAQFGIFDGELMLIFFIPIIKTHSYLPLLEMMHCLIEGTFLLINSP